MAKINVKGYEFDLVHATNSFDRRALQYKNKVITELAKLGIARDDIEFEYEGPAVKQAKAEVAWYGGGHYMHYDNNSQSKYVDNLYVVYKVIEHEIELVTSEKKPVNEFIDEFKHDEELIEKRKEAREFFGLSPTERDMDLITKKYKEMAKELHPDMPTGDTEKFKQLNNAHKILKKELM